jgi:hypothetical protein
MSPENSKPEWFQMADADATPPQPKSRRVIRIMALATPLLVLGAGLVFAQTQESPIAVASAATAATTATPATTDATARSISPIVASAPRPSSTPVSSAVQVSQSSPAPQSSSVTIAKPSIATMPTGGGSDDGIRSSDDD